MLFCAGKPGHAALPPSRKVLVQKHLSVCKKQPRRHFLPLPASSCSHFIFPLLLPRDTAGLLTVVLLTLCCNSALSMVPAGYLSSPKPGCTWIPKAVLYSHRFSLLDPRRGLLRSSQLHRMFYPFLSKHSRFGYCNILSCGLAENHPDTFVFIENAAMKIFSAPCCSDHIPLPCFSFAVTSVSHIQNKCCAFSSRFFSWLTSNWNITSTATKMHF